MAETRRLLILFAVPRSAHRLNSGPAALDGPAMGTPESGSLIDTARFWRVPMSLARAASWINAHRPSGLKQTGNASGHGPDGVESLGYGYADNRSSRMWTQGELDIGLAPAGSGTSVWRIDGLAQWLDPRPERARAEQHPLRATVTAGCPASDRGADGVPPGPADSLLPAGTPTDALICTYTGLNGDTFTLAAHRLLGAAEAARLATMVGKIDLAHIDRGTTSCPADFGTVTVIALRYSSTTEAALWLTDSGCRYLSNGTIVAGGDSAAWQAFTNAMPRATGTR